ncbi:hypothetical protein D3C80_408520 [compost metagenome]
MKKLILPLVFSALALTSFAQSTSKGLSGYYKSSFSEVNFQLFLFENQRFQLSLNQQEHQSDIKGVFTLKNDTLRFSTDNVFDRFVVNQKMTTNEVPVTKIAIVLGEEDTYYADYIQLMIGDKYDKEKLKAVSTFEKKDSVYYFSQKINADDHLFIVNSLGGSKSYVYDYALNNQINELYIGQNRGDILDVFNQLYAYKGKEANEIVITDGRSPLSFFFIRSIEKADDKKAEPTFVKPVKSGITTLTKQSLFLDSTFEYNYSDAAVADTVAAAYDYSADSISVFTDYSKALTEAKNTGKYLVMYYEPKDCSGCTSTINEVLREAKSAYSYIAGSVNKSYVFYQVPEADKNRFKKYTIKKFPAMVILTPQEELLYYGYGPDNKTQLDKVFTYYTDFVNNLKMQQVNVVLPARVEKSGYSEPELVNYLKESALVKSEQYADATTPAYDGYHAESAKKDLNNFSSPLETAYDTLRVVHYLDTLIAKYKLNSPPDTATVNLIAEVMINTDETYCPLMTSQYIASVDGQMKVSPAMQYLLKNYAELKNYQYKTSADSYYDDEGRSLYEIISERIKRALYAAETEEGQRKMLAFQQEFIRQTPEVEHFETPVLINNLNFYAGKLSLQPMFEEVAINYCEAIAKNPEAVRGIVDGVYTKLASFQKKAFDVSLSDNHYAILGEYCNSEKGDKACFDQVMAATLNTAAWSFFENKVNDELLKKALNWSKSSLVLEKNNPYYLDTYAHLLYRLGNKVEALKQQQLAVAKAADKKSGYYIQEDMLSNMKGDLQKMKAGTL